MTQPRPAVVRFYVDQDLRGAGILLGGLRHDLTYPGDAGAVVHKRARQPSPIPEGAKDIEWLPTVGEQGWLTISRDRNIQDSLSELTAVQAHLVKMVCLTGELSRNKWGQLETLMTYWHLMEPLADRTGPFVYKLSKPGGLREVNIDSALDRLRNGRRHNPRK
jgi:hypothetical protein